MTERMCYKCGLFPAIPHSSYCHACHAEINRKTRSHAKERKRNCFDKWLAWSKRNNIAEIVKKMKTED